MKRYLIYIGLKEKSKEYLEGQQNIKETYIPTEYKDVAERYLAYLKEIHAQQRDRRTAIENKNSQLVGQASIVTSIFALFIPLLINNLNGVTLWLKISLSLLFLIVMFHYLLSILHAIKTLTVNKYKYPGRNTISVTKVDRETNELDFINSEIKDLVYIIKHTSPIDDIKGGNLIYAARCFKIGNIGFGIMTMFVIISTFLLEKETPALTIKNINDLKFEIPDTLSTRIIDLQLKDTLMVKIDSTSIKKSILELDKEFKKKK